MHFFMILTALALAVILRLLKLPIGKNWRQRWHRSLFVFLLPPLLLLMTVSSILCMGPQGHMLGLQASWLSYLLAGFFVGIAIILLLKLTYLGYLCERQVREYSQQLVAGKMARILEIDFPYSAQIGFWHSELVVSRGLLNSLDREHLKAVLAHEQAHYYYRDTFYFFWLSWLRSLTAWLPNTDTLWQELLLLREMRADAWAAERIDALLLAESLVIVAKNAIESDDLNFSDDFCAALSCSVPRDRLAERIDALLSQPNLLPSSSYYWYLSSIFFALLPLTMVPFHY
ncbi:MAG: M56 family metallopeptidase [Prochloraceae cyanobacterium]|nr:M56 family metallopeptidase [Prochloraceae cyanobacterium]